MWRYSRKTNCPKVLAPIIYSLDICTGKVAGSLIQDVTNSSIYYKCGQCSIQEVIVCEPGKTYDQQCGKCVSNPHPNCDQIGME